MEHGALFYFHAIRLGYRSLFIKVYLAASSDQDFEIKNWVKCMKTMKFTIPKEKKKDFEIEEYKRPKVKYLPSHPKSDSQAYTSFPA